MLDEYDQRRNKLQTRPERDGFAEILIGVVVKEMEMGPSREKPDHRHRHASRYLCEDLHRHVDLLEVK